MLFEQARDDIQDRVGVRVIGRGRDADIQDQHVDGLGGHQRQHLLAVGCGPGDRQPRILPKAQAITVDRDRVIVEDAD